MNIRPSNPEDQPTLLDIWERSVRASHDFLSEQDIELIRAVVNERALPHLELWVLCNGAQEPMGFMGLDENRLEAMFIDPSHFRQGGGFEVVGRSPTDSLGLPFPLLHLSEANHHAT